MVMRKLKDGPPAAFNQVDFALDSNEIGDNRLDVRYEDKKLEKLCTDEREMRKKRAHIADRLQLRINALETATSVGELATHDPLGYWHPLGANLDGLWSGKLSANYRLYVQPNDAADPLSSATVTVIDIDDYHQGRRSHERHQLCRCSRSIAGGVAR